MDDEDVTGPMVEVELPDGQVVHAVLRSRRQAPDGSWWYEVGVPVYSFTELAGGRSVAEPTTVWSWAPVTACTPVEGQDYAAVPTERVQVAPAWLIEERTAEDVVVVHRGDCADRQHGVLRAATPGMVRQAVSTGAVPCPTCRPDRALAV